LLKLTIKFEGELVEISQNRSRLAGYKARHPKEMKNLKRGLFKRLDAVFEAVNNKQQKAKKTIKTETLTDLIEVTGFSDNTASDAWRPTTNAESKPIGSDKVLEVNCVLTWKDQGWGGRKS
jgi:hypothetical protein